MIDKNILKNLEIKLLDFDIRKSLQELDKLIADDFEEFGASGKVYSKKITIEMLPVQKEKHYVLKNLEVYFLDENVAQIRYESEEKNLETGEIRNCLRSSLWRKKGHSWEMFFHQGTIKK